MGKHNGKARASGGPRVGAALVRKGRGGGNGAGAGRHTTEMHQNMQSVLDRNDLDELMAMADLAERDFTADRASNAVVVSVGAPADAAAAAASAADRVAAEATHASSLTVPRRPPWGAATTPDELDAAERATFLDWRRALAALEESQGLLLTPFEKNLEVWRQLWRVLERSDVVVQVVDARDPLTYWSPDLAAYARELHPTKASIVLLNKADLLPAAVREAWAAHFDAVGVPYAFWSAAAAADAQAAAKAAATAAAASGYGLGAVAAASPAAKAAADSSGSDERTRVLNVEELLELLEGAARRAAEEAGRSGEVLPPGGGDEDGGSDDDGSDGGDGNHRGRRRLMVGLVGYPNVGKSSTINAIFGAKKTAVAPTPGKTKHFQTLYVAPALCLCDCPGLVLPRFAGSKAEMVAAGVVPIDRLTDVRAPVEVVALRCGRAQLEQAYGLRLPPPPPASGAAAEIAAAVAAARAGGGAVALGGPSAPSLLNTLATSRGWGTGNGLPDEVKAGRQLLKDYTSGRLLFCRLPPGTPLGGVDGADEVELRGFAPMRAATTAGDLEGLGLNAVDNAVAAAELEILMMAQQRGAAGGAGASTSGAAAGAAATAQQQPAAAAAASDDDGTGDASDSSYDSQDLIEPVAPDDGGGGSAILLDAADLELLGALDGALAGGADAAAAAALLAQQRAARAAAARRAEHKFHKKAARTKGDRGKAQDAGDYDGAALATGKRGGLVRVTGY